MHRIHAGARLWTPLLTMNNMKKEAVLEEITSTHSLYHSFLAESVGFEPTIERSPYT